MTDKSFIKNVLSHFPGKMVAVNNHKMHVYTEGKGAVTLVFMSGSGTCSPMYDFKTLFSRMSDEYQIAVVERAGYGYSEISNMSRDIDTVLFETRTALKEANINPPYILFPHSMSAIEAFYWVQCCPNEIKAIIEIDPALPIHYETWDINYSLKRMKFYSKLINKWLKFLRPIVASNLPPLKNGILTKQDKKACKAISNHRILTNDMINETLVVKENAKKIDAEALKRRRCYFLFRMAKKLE
jgi:alpha-beta hydrolase superfamily lysophospholipase